VLACAAGPATSPAGERHRAPGDYGARRVASVDTRRSPCAGSVRRAAKADGGTPSRPL
jgi:hypothetical protein